MVRVAWAPVWLATFIYSYAVTTLAARPVAVTFRAIGALAAACLAYVLVMSAVILVFKPSGSHAATIYAVGMAVSTMVGTSIAGLVMPARWRDHGMIACVAAGLAYPVYLTCASDSAAPVRLMLSLYLAGTMIGGFAAVVRANWGDRSLADLRLVPVKATAAAG